MSLKIKASSNATFQIQFEDEWEICELLRPLMGKIICVKRILKRTSAVGEDLCKHDK